MIHEKIHVVIEGLISQIFKLLAQSQTFAFILRVQHVVKDLTGLSFEGFPSQFIANTPNNMELVEQMSKLGNISIVTEGIQGTNQRHLLISHNSLGKQAGLLEEHQEQRYEIFFSLMKDKADSTDHRTKIFNRSGKDTNIPESLIAIFHDRNTADLVCNIEHDSLTKGLIVFLHIFCHNEKDLRHWIVLRPVLVSNQTSILLKFFQVIFY